MKIFKIVSCNASVDAESIPWKMIEKLDPFCSRNDQEIWTLAHIKFVMEIPDDMPIPATWKAVGHMGATATSKHYYVNILGPSTCLEEKEFT